MGHVFFNEKSLSSTATAEEVLRFLHGSFTAIQKKKLEMHTLHEEFRGWFLAKATEFDYTLKSYGYQLLKKLLPLPSRTCQHYYYHFTHQDLGLSIGENISDSSIAAASDFVLQNHSVAVLNAPKSVFAEREHIPVLLSPYDRRQKDILVQVPSFPNEKSLLRFLLLKSMMAGNPQFSTDEKFLSECVDHCERFDYAAWRPKTFKPGAPQRLDASIAFPISTCSHVASKIDGLFASGSTSEKKALYTQYGDLVLQLNYYLRNPGLSKFYGYDIYEAGHSNHKLLISLDTENGGLEVIDHTGAHIGVYGYNGSFIKDYSNNAAELKKHSLANLPSSKFLL